MTVLSFLIGVVLPAQGFVHEPFEHYQERRIEGFRVYVSYAARQNPVTTQPATELLESKLQEISRLIPGPALKVLRETPFFVEHNAPDHPCACYHPDQGWLKEHGYIPEKWRSVEISNCRNFVDWQKKTQPMMVLHELAHAFHDRKLGYNDPYIESCFKLAALSGKLESVAHVSGEKRKHYGLNNPMEYFAEATEAYFGKNDFFPFVREELKREDPKAAEMIELVWGLRK